MIRDGREAVGSEMHDARCEGCGRVGPLAIARVSTGLPSLDPSCEASAGEEPYGDDDVVR